MMSGDQAGMLRELVAKRQVSSQEPVITIPSLAITSGKGGVGKSSSSVFLAKSFASMGERVLLLDGDMGLANLHIILGVSVQFSLKDYLTGRCSLEDVIYEVAEGVFLLPGASGDMGLANISPADIGSFLQKLNALSGRFSRIIIDGGAGIAENSLRLTLAASQVLVVITPDPTSLADAYATIKVLKSRGITSFYVLVNLVDTEEEGKAVEEKLCLLTERFLQVTPTFVGRLPRDKKVGVLIREERSLLHGKGLGEFQNRIDSCVKVLKGEPVIENGGFFEKLLTLFSGDE